jgi:integrase
VADWLREWLVIKSPQIERNTHAFHESNIRIHIVPHIGRTPLAKLQPQHVAQMYSVLAKMGVSPATQRHAGVTLSTALNDAVRMRLIPSNPAKMVKKPKSRRREIHPLDPAQLHAFLDAATNDRHLALYTFAVDSGMRQGEIFGLLWQEIDWDAGAVAVVRSLEERDGRHRLKDVKNPSSRRRIRLSPATMALLNQHRQQLVRGHYREDGAVFTNTRGGWLRKPNFYRAFARALKRADLEGVRFHDVRHTTATLLLLGGVNIKAVSARLGHSTIKTTLDVYAHVMPDMEEQAATLMDGFLKNRIVPRS